MNPRFNPSHLRCLPDNDHLNMPQIRQWLDGDDSNWRLIKNNAKRSVYISGPLPGSNSHIYIKYDHPPKRRDQLKSYIKPKVVREFYSGDLLNRLNTVPNVFEARRLTDKAWLYWSVQATGTVIPAKAGTSVVQARSTNNRHPGEGRDLMKMCRMFGWDRAWLMEVPACAGMTLNCYRA